MTRTSSLLLAGLVAALGVGGVAMAQSGPRGGTAAPMYDPAQLPEVKGRVAHYLLTPMGDVAGLILTDGTEVHVAPFASSQLVFAVRPGDAVTVHGLKAKALAIVAARSITNDASGVTVLAMPRSGMHRGGGAALDAEGKVVALLHTPRGEVNGAQLEDGTQLRMPPSEATRLAAVLEIGRSVTVKGVGYAGPLGRVIMAQQIGADRASLGAVASPRPMGPPWRRHREDGGGRHGEGHGGMMMGPGRHAMPPG